MSLSFPRPPVFTGELNLVVKNQTAFWRNFDSLPLSVKVMFPWWRKHSILKIIKWKPNLKVSIIHYVFSKLFAVLPQEWIGSQCMIVWYIFKSWHTFWLLKPKPATLRVEPLIDLYHIFIKERSNIRTSITCIVDFAKK